MGSVAAMETWDAIRARRNVRSYTDLATMEGANEAARRAVNAILDRTGSHAARCGVCPPATARAC